MSDPDDVLQLREGPPRCFASPLLEAYGIGHGFYTRDGDPDVPVRRVKQVHGTDLAGVADLPTCEADGVVLRAGEGWAGVVTADCCPVLIAGDGAVAAVHAGWRGMVAGIVEKAATEIGGAVAAVGPCIGVEAFEVGEEVAAAFVGAGLGDAVVRRDMWPRPHVDLPLAALLCLRRAKLDADDVDVGRLCTHSRPADFYSYRRDGPGTGRMLSVIHAR